MEESGKAVRICDPKHEANLFAFCVTDLCYTCEKCFEKSHRGHTVEYLKFLVRDHLKAAQTMEGMVGKSIAECDQGLQVFSKKKLAEKISCAVRGYYDELIQALQISCENIISRIHKGIFEEMSNLDKVSKKLSLEKDKMIVLLCEIRQQIKVYEKELQTNKFKWFHEHYVKLCEYEAQTKELQSSVADGIEELTHNFPEIDFTLPVKDVAILLERSIKVNKSPENRPVMETPAKKSLFTVTSTSGPRTAPRSASQNSSGKKTPVLRKNAYGAKSALNITYSNKSIPKPRYSKDESSKQVSQSHQPSAKISGRISLSPSRNKVKANPHIFFIDQPTSTLCMIQVPSKEISSIPLYGKQAFPDGYAAIEIVGKILLTGGERNKNIIKDSFEVNAKTAVIISKAPMRIHRRNHGMVGIRNRAYVMGGYNKELNILNKCEMYDVTKDKWSEIPALNVERNFMSTCTVNDRLIYVFGGSATESVKRVNSYEWINTDSLNAWKWLEITKDSTFGEFEIGYGGGTIQTGPHEILLFGGLNESKYFSYSALLNTETGKVVKTNTSLKIKEAFYQRTPVLHEGKVYSVGFLTKSLHVFDVVKQQWSLFNLFPK